MKILTDIFENTNDFFLTLFFEFVEEIDFASATVMDFISELQDYNSSIKPDTFVIAQGKSKTFHLHGILKNVDEQSIGQIHELIEHYGFKLGNRPEEAVKRITRGTIGKVREYISVQVGQEILSRIDFKDLDKEIVEEEEEEEEEEIFKEEIKFHQTDFIEILYNKNFIDVSRVNRYEKSVFYNLQNIGCLGRFLVTVVSIIFLIGLSCHLLL